MCPCHGRARGIHHCLDQRLRLSSDPDRQLRHGRDARMGVNRQPLDDPLSREHRLDDLLLLSGHSLDRPPPTESYLDVAIGIRPHRPLSRLRRRHMGRVRKNFSSLTARESYPAFRAAFFF